MFHKWYNTSVTINVLRPNTSFDSPLFISYGPANTKWKKTSDNKPSSILVNMHNNCMVFMSTI